MSEYSGHTLWCRIGLLGLLLILSACAANSSLEKSGSPASYHFQMGMSYLGERNYTSALVEFVEAEKDDPDNPDLLHNLARAYMGKKRYDLASPKLQRALKQRANFSLARNDLGVAYLELKRWDDAIVQFKMVKDDLFYADSDSAAINLGLAYLGKGDYLAAVEELKVVAQTNPRNPVCRLSLGRVYDAMGRREQAITEYQRALDIFPEYGAAYYYLGLAYYADNKFVAAKTYFTETVRIIPESELGRSAAEYLEQIR